MEMKALAARLYGEFDLRLEPIELAPAGEDAILVELVTNSVCMSDYKAVSLATKHKRVPKDIATHPVMVGHEVCGKILEVGKRWQGQFHVGQHVGLQPALNVPGHELETVGYAYHTVGGDTTAVRLPSIVMEMGCLLPYSGDAFFKCSLAEPISCIVSAFRTSYHNAFNSHAHVMGLKSGGSMLLLAGCGAMGLGAIDLALHGPENHPSRLVVTDIDDARLARAAEIFPAEMAKKAGCDLHFVNTKNMADPVAELKALNKSDIDSANPISTGGGYDDIFVFAPVPALITQCSDLMGFGGCLNFFSGPTDQKFSATFNFYNVHYMNHHVLGSSGGDVKDMTDPIEWISRGLSIRKS